MPASFSIPYLAHNNVRHFPNIFHGNHLAHGEFHAEFLLHGRNQFNLTTKRYTQGEIEQTAASPDYITLYGKLEDKFGDNGVVSVIIGHKKETNLHIDLWIMSCRVLKRDMEYAMMDRLAEEARKAGIAEIIGYYYPTAKNHMVENFYELQGFTKTSEDEQGNTVWGYKIPDSYTKKNRYIEIC